MGKTRKSCPQNNFPVHHWLCEVQGLWVKQEKVAHKTILQYTISCVRYKVYGENKKKMPTSKTIKAKYIGPADKLHADGIKKRQ
jgi:hypothetical protein